MGDQMSKQRRSQQHSSTRGENFQGTSHCGFHLHHKADREDFAVLFVISAICVPFVGINYDMSKYLPQDSAFKVGINLMEEVV